MSPLSRLSEETKVSAPGEASRRQALIDQVVDEFEQFAARALLHGRIASWLSVDLTMPQLKTLLLVVERPEGATGSQLARALGISLSTVTGLVDRLCEHGLVARGEDPADRRATRVTPLPAGHHLVGRLYRLRRERLTRLLGYLDEGALTEARQAIRHLTRASAALELDEAGRGDAGRLGIGAG
jgi:DNA-binding MarR family transcriptional regulator